MAEAANYSQVHRSTTRNPGSAYIVWDEDTNSEGHVLEVDLGIIPPVNYTDDHTLTAEDACRYVRINKGTAVNLTVPPSSSVNFTIGTQIPVRAVGAGQVAIVAGAGVTINPPESGTLVLTGQGSTVTLIKVATDEWDLTGDVVAA